MNPNELCQKLRITEKQLSKICHHLRITIPDEMVGEFTPEEIEHLQSFVAKKRSTGSKSSDNKLIMKKESPVSAVSSEHLNSVQVSPQPNIVVNLPAEASAGVGLRACAYIIDCLVTLFFHLWSSFLYWDSCSLAFCFSSTGCCETLADQVLEN